MFFRTDFLKTNGHRKKHVIEPLFNKVAGLKACNYIKKSLQCWCFPVIISKFLRTAFLYNTCGGYFWLLEVNNSNKDNNLYAVMLYFHYIIILVLRIMILIGQ